MTYSKCFMTQIVRPVLILLFLSCSSCSQKPAPVTDSVGVVSVVSPRVTALLESEARSLPRHERDFDGIFDLQNNSNHSISVQLASLSCGCFRPLHNDQPLEIGSLVQLAPGASSSVVIPRRSVELGTKTYSANLKVIATDVVPAQDIKLIYEISVNPDLSVIPSTIVRPLPKPQKSDEVRLALLRRCRSVTSVMGPPLVSSVSTIITCGEPVKLEDWHETGNGLFEDRWQFDLLIHGFEDSGPVVESSIRIVFDKNPAHVGVSKAIPVRLDRSEGLIGPKVLHFGTVRKGESVHRRIVIKAADSIPFKIVRAKDCPNDELGVNFVNDVSKVQIVTVEFSPKATGDDGLWTRTIVLETTHEQSVIKIDLRAQVGP